MDEHDEIMAGLKHLEDIVRGCGSSPGLVTDVALLKSTVSQMVAISAETTKNLKLLGDVITQLSVISESHSKIIAKLDEKGTTWSQLTFAALSPDVIKQSEVRKSIVTPITVGIIMIIIGYVLGTVLK